MLDARTRANLNRTAHLTARTRTLGRLTDGKAANADHLAELFLLRDQRSWSWGPRLAGCLFARLIAGAFGYSQALVRYFNALLSNGLEQLVALRASFDSRSLRFRRSWQRRSPYGVRLRDEFDAVALEQRDLRDLPGQPRKEWSVMRGAHAGRS